MKFHIIQLVWGEAYIDLLLNVVLPSQLAPGNLPVFRDSDHQGIYKIYTTTNAAQRIGKNPIFLQLCSIMPTEFVFVDGIVNTAGIMSPEQKYHAMSECHRMAIEGAWKSKAALIFVSADLVPSDGTFARFLKIAESGKRAVVGCPVRVVKETFVPGLLSGFRVADGTIRVSSRELVKLACEHWHPITRSLFLDAIPFNKAASHLYWNIPREGVLARGFHLSPLMVIPYKAPTSFSVTFDYDYLLGACPNIDDIYVVEDSDELMYIEMSSRSYSLVESKVDKFSPFQVARRMNLSTNSQHHAFLRHRIRLHSKDVSTRWSEVEQESDRAVESILFWLKSGRILLWHPTRTIRMALVHVLGEPSTRQLIRWTRSLYQRVMQ